MALLTEEMRMHKNGQMGKSATDITTKAIALFSANVISDFVDKTLVDINARNKPETGTICASCKTQNLLRCPTKGICIKINKQCEFHLTPDLLPRPCPNGICDNIRDNIIIHHNFISPSWKNTKAEEWCTNSWQVAKCFFPPGGYVDVRRPDDTDFNGFMSLIMNCTLFKESFNEDPSKVGSVCYQARKAGNLVRHAPHRGITDIELSGCFDALVAFLSDTKHQTNNPKTIPGLQMLTKLQPSSYIISTGDRIVVQQLTSSSSDESSSKSVSECPKEDEFWYIGEGSSSVDDGRETDRDSIWNESSSLLSEDSQTDSHGKNTTADQCVNSKVEANQREKFKESPCVTNIEEKKAEESCKCSSNVYDGREIDRCSVRNNSSSLSSGSCVDIFLAVILVCLFGYLMANVTILFRLCTQTKDVDLFSGQQYLFGFISIICSCIIRFNLALPLAVVIVSADGISGQKAVAYIIYIYSLSLFTMPRFLPPCRGIIKEFNIWKLCFTQLILYYICYFFVTYTSKELTTFGDQMNHFEYFHFPLTFEVVECRYEENSSDHNVTNALSEMNESIKTKMCLRIGDHDFQPIATVLPAVLLTILLCVVYELLRRRLRRIPVECVMKTCIEKLHHTSNANLESGSFKLKFMAVVNGMIFGLLRLDQYALIYWCCNADTYIKKCINNVIEYSLLGSCFSSSLFSSLFSILLSNDKGKLIYILSAIIGSLSFLLTILCFSVIEKVGKLSIIQRILENEKDSKRNSKRCSLKICVFVLVWITLLLGYTLLLFY